MQSTIEEVIEAWKKGDTIWTAELGGMGPGYEQAIQILLFEICCDMYGKPLPEKDLTGWGEETVKRLDGACYGFSGAQVRAAKITAYQFLKYGYKEMMDKLPEDRKIMVSRECPSLPIPK